MTPLQVAVSQLGKQEEPKGSNWGPDVQKYLASVGISFPAAWCCAFVYWCFKQSDSRTTISKTGGVLALWNRTPAPNKVKTPQAGDIFIMDFGGGLGHTGFVERVDGQNIHTIEGNATNDSGTREGYIVCRKVRQHTKIKGYIRL